MKRFNTLISILFCISLGTSAWGGSVASLYTGSGLNNGPPFHFGDFAWSGVGFPFHMQAFNWNPGIGSQPFHPSVGAKGGIGNCLFISSTISAVVPSPSLGAQSGGNVAAYGGLAGQVSLLNNQVGSQGLVGFLGINGFVNNSPAPYGSGGGSGIGTLGVTAQSIAVVTLSDGGSTGTTWPFPVSAGGMSNGLAYLASYGGTASITAITTAGLGLANIALASVGSIGAQHDPLGMLRSDLIPLTAEGSAGALSSLTVTGGLIAQSTSANISQAANVGGYITNSYATLTAAAISPDAAGGVAGIGTITTAGTGVQGAASLTGNGSATGVAGYIATILQATIALDPAYGNAGITAITAAGTGVHNDGWSVTGLGAATGQSVTATGLALASFTITAQGSASGIGTITASNAQNTIAYLQSEGSGAGQQTAIVNLTNATVTIDASGAATGQGLASETMVNIYATAGTFTNGFTAPTGVTSVIAEAWGGGGGGANITGSNTGGGGGGGGAYAIGTVSVTGGNSYTYVVGAAGAGGASPGAGGASSFNTSSVVAAGGTNATANSSTGGAGGTTAASTGTTAKYAGGYGHTWASGTYGAGGGGSGGTAAAGNFTTLTSASDNSAGAAVTGGGIGGLGAAAAGNGSAPASGPGGGGGGAYRATSSTRNGGAGYAGQVRITYTNQ